eukprot:834986-Lingulodinium_polyedra.AAC.1
MGFLTDLRRAQGKQFEDLGPPPTPEQRLAAAGNDGPDDVPMDDEEMPTAAAGPRSHGPSVGVAGRT